MTANAGELFRAGRLREATEAQVLEVKAHPADPDRRLFLFELLAFGGELERARRQVDAIELEPQELRLALSTYAGLLDAESLRREVFRAGATPSFLADPPPHVALRLEALARLRDGDAPGASARLEEANAGLPTLAGTLDGRGFEGLRDADDRFGTVLEVMAHGKYYWVPLEQVDRLAMGPPRFPRDLLWIPARLELADTAGDVFLPALYPSSHEHADDLVRLGRQTDWADDGGGPMVGVGLHTFLAGEDACGLLEWRELVLGRGPVETPGEGP